MQKPHRPVRVIKLPLVLQLRIGLAIEIFKISGLPIAMVACLHQWNVYIKRKLRVWRAQKCNFLVSAITEPTVVGQQTTPCLAAPYGQAIEIFKISGLPIDMVPCLHQCNVFIVRKLRVWRAKKCNFVVSGKNRTDICESTNYPVSCCAVFGSNKNFYNFGATYRHGSVFAPMQCYIVRKQRGLTAQKCNFLVSAKTDPTVVGQQTTPCLAVPYWEGIEIFKISGLPIDMVPCLHQCNVYIKRKLRVWRVQKCDFLHSAKTEPTVVGQQTTLCLAAPYWASIRIFKNFGATYLHGTVLTPMQCLYYKETSSLESSKLQFPSQCKNRTDRYGSTNHPVSCSAVFGKQ